MNEIQCPICFKRKVATNIWIEMLNSEGEERSILIAACIQCKKQKSKYAGIGALLGLVSGVLIALGVERFFLFPLHIPNWLTLFTLAAIIILPTWWVANLGQQMWVIIHEGSIRHHPEVLPLLKKNWQLH